MSPFEVSVPYPLSISAGRVRRCFKVLGFQDVESKFICVGVVGDVEVEPTRRYDVPSLRKRSVSAMHFRTIAGSITNFEKPVCFRDKHWEGKSSPKTGVNANRMS